MAPTRRTFNAVSASDSQALEWTDPVLGLVVAVLTLRSLFVDGGAAEATGADADLGAGTRRVVDSRALPESSPRSGVDSPKPGALSWIARMALRTKSALDMCLDSSAMCKSVLSISMAPVTVWTTPCEPKTVVVLHS